MARVSTAHRRGAILTNTFFPSERMLRLIELMTGDERQENERRGRRGLEGGNDLVVDRQCLTHLDLS